MSEKNGQTKSLEAKLPWYYNVYNTIKDTPINLTLLLVSAFVFYKVVNISRQRRNLNRVRNFFGYGKDNEKSQLPPLQRDFTVKELLEYNGTREDGRILVAVNYNIYDVSCAKQVYGQTGAYPQWAGSDISRNLINFTAERNENQEFDYMSDLTAKQRSNLMEWDQQYSEKYPLVGHLVSDDEDENEEHTVVVENDEGDKEEIEKRLGTI
ncbi:membrane-associated progesterone receptor component 1 [Drosophila hydei]|uniref:Membrane-associated progesterone receptor component 1 n=1 Tax=Drosophila hydei TaxID=7224 RepID=A0A6J1LER4_DROHY|nr:membrane-associated progesterone receptor component 1 [Drosophila hydei]XP_023163908.1 membrane-associated progesterone receptor component 1 [Drosophila hydei]